MKSQTISLCMIVKNEEKTLARSLESVKDLVDEIVVVDTGSMDNTVVIAKQFGAKVFHFEWTNDFAEARNFALQKCKCDYVLSLDADEWLHEDSKFMLNEPLVSDYYFVRIRNVIRAGIVETHSFIRLFRRSVGYVYEGAIHEQINVQDFPESTGEHIQLYINHDGYTRSTIVEKNKNSRNMSIIEKELQENPDAFGYFNLGTQYKLIGELNRAIEAYKKSYALGSDRLFTHKLIVNLVQCLTELKRYQDALDVINDSIKLQPDYTDYYYYLGVIYVSMRYWRDAEECFLKCLELGEVKNHIFTSLEGVGSYLANAYLGLINMELGFKEKAQSYLISSIQQNPLHIPSLKMWLDMYLAAKPIDLMEKLSQLYRIESSEHVTVLMQSLYQLRSPLFVEISKSIHTDFDVEVTAWVLQVNGDFEGAKGKWYSCETIMPSSFREIVYLSVVTGDHELFNKFKSVRNLRQKEEQFIQKLIKKEHIDKAAKTAISKDLADLFSNLCYDILTLHNYEIIEYLMGHVHVPILRYELALQLKKFNFTELALNALIEPEGKEDKQNVFMLAGQLLQDMDQLGDSFYYFSEALHYQSSFEVTYKIYQLAIKVGDQETSNKMLKQMRGFKPRSPWLAAHMSRQIL